jgi:hypothetical protein
MGRFFRVFAAAVLALAVTAALAVAEPTSDPLLKAYPLEQRPATVANAPAPSSAADRPREDGSDGPRLTQGAAIAIACAAMLLAGLVVTRRRRDVNVAPLSSGAVPNAAGEQPRAAAAEPTPVGPAPSPPARPPTALPAPAPRDGVLCQIRWECDGSASWFTAVPTKFRDREPVADSADFAWAGTEPPPRTPDAQAALHDLIEELQLDGWQPVRGRGRQHGAPRWYARRFVLPTLGPEPRIANEPMDSAEADIG